MVGGGGSLQINPNAVVRGEISGFKFNDLDGDGVKDAGEPGLADWAIQLYKDDGDGVFEPGPGGDMLQTELTSDGTDDVNGDGVADPIGYYEFSPLTRGTYFVLEVQQAGWSQTLPTSNLYTITITQTTPVFENKNFGNRQLGAISGKKFNDLDGDGTDDGGSDPGLAGWTIQLDKDANGTVDATTVTGPGGAYSFTNLTAGTYRIREVGQVGWTQITVNPADVNVVSGTNSTGNNFGNFQLGAISGKKFNDLDGDGTDDGGSDPGLAGWTIQLDKDANGTVDATTVTGPGGTYSFTNLTAGTYRIREVGQVGWTQITVNPADVNVVSGTNSTGNNFGNFQLGAISGKKFNDLDGDGTDDGGSDPGLAGWTIQLDKDANGTVDATTVTGPGGAYSFTNLTAGTYRIREVGQVGWTQITVNPADVNVVSGTNSTGNNFGNFQLGAISGKKFNDLDGDGTDDGGSDPGLAGWTIQLDKDANGTVDATTVTGPGGAYSFTNLTAGTYRIREVGQVGWTQITVNPADVNVVSGTNSTGNNFGNFQLGAISGKKFNDLDGDGTDDGGSDPGLAGWTIQLDKDANGTVDATTVTGPGGAYSFTNLTAGTYRIREVGQVGWTQTTVNPADVNVVSGTNSTGNNFGNFQLGAISGKKFNDLDGDGTDDGGSDPGLAGWTIQLDKDANGTVDATTVTGPGGAYSFTNLTAGTYRIREVGQVGWTQITVNPADVNVVSGTNSTGNNFGNFQLGAISGKKFNDLDGDGTDDGGSDPGLAGWTIQLDKDANGTVDATTVTGPGGAYSFTNLTAGTYRIREVGQVGWTQITVNPADVNVVSGTNSTGNNFGNFQLGAISGKKFNDLDGDGTDDGGSDPGLAGWTIQLDKDANGTVDATTVTGPGGAYSFTNLTAGTYRIREVGQVGWTQITVNPADVNVVSGTNSTGNNFGNYKNCYIIIGPDKGNTSAPLVKVINKDTGNVLVQFYAYETSFLGGVRLATGDLTGDGIDEIITAPGQGRVGEVRVFTQNGVELTQFRTVPYGNSYTGGVEVAVGDVNGDGKNDIVTSNSYGRTDVRVFFNSYPALDPIPNSPNKQFFAFASSFKGGADVVIADVGTFSNGVTINATTPDGKSEIVVGNGPGMRSTILVYDVTGTPAIVDTILPFSNSFNGGITLDAARINADAIPDFIVAAGNGGGSAVQIWSGLTNDVTDTLLSAFNTFADQSTKNAPVHATAFDSNGDGIADVLAVVQGTNGKSNQIRKFQTNGAALGTLSGFTGPWNIASSCNMDLSSPGNASFAATDNVFTQLGSSVSTSVKKPKVKPKKR